MSQTWNIDPSHTSVSFAVKHMVIATVRGNLKLTSGTAQISEDGKLLGVEAVIDATTINTADSGRDGHLNSPEFLDTANHATLIFKSYKVDTLGGNEYKVTGDLTIRGTTNPITLDVEATPAGKDPWGNTRMAATATGKLSRKEWGLVWNQTLETGGLLVSDEVKLTLDVQAVQPAATSA
jgi:polyisoprenoid-binding protein YceI